MRFCKNNQLGVVPLPLLLTGIGLLAFLFFVSLLPFKSNLFNTIYPKSTSQAAVDEWTQDGHDAQRTGTTIEEPVTPWTFKWSFNGPDATGSASAHFYDAPKEARTVTGGANIYVPAGSRGLYALKKVDGTTAWNFPGIFNSTPSYDPANQTVIAGSNDGKVYKINAATGLSAASYDAGNPVNKSMLITGGFAYAVTDNGQLHKINLTNMTQVWVYSAGSAANTPVAYSPSRDVFVYATADLNVHAVNNNNGLPKWKTKPTPHVPALVNGRTGFTFDKGWPVIAEKNGVVFLRIQLPHSYNLNYPSPQGIFPNDLATTRAWLTNNPENQNLFALNLDDGSKKFIPVVGYGSTEDYDPVRNEAFGVMGTQPIVKVNSDGSEVVYIFFRNGQSNPPDYRWDGHLGEMVLDNTTVPGLSAGDLRFVKMTDAPTNIIDEQTPLSMAGDTIFDAHWSASLGSKILDRSSAKGLSFADPITSTKHPTVVRSQKTCGNFVPLTHYTTCHLSYVTDGGRFYNGPGFWGYWNVVDPPGWRTGITPAIGSAYSTGILPRYTYVSDGQMIVEGNGGELLVFSHSGGSSQPSPSPVVSPSPTPSLAPGVETVDSTDLRVTFDGWFPTTSNAALYGGSERVGEFGGTSVTMPFTGNAITLIYTQNTDHGQAQIMIDNVLVETLDQYGTQQYQKEKTYPVTQGSHTLKIVVTRTKQTAATSYFFSVDALRITQQTPPSPTPVLSPSPAASPSPAKPGDVDGNGRVDIFDYNTLLTNYGRTGTGVSGDLDQNGRVDIFDYNILLTNFGK